MRARGQYDDHFIDLVHSGVLTIGDDGSVWRLQEHTRTGRRKPVQPRRCDTQRPDGYREVKSGRRRFIMAHRLVWLCLIGPITDGHEINHKDGRRGRNVLSNLEPLTPAENTQHAYDALNRHRATGERIATHKLTDSQRSDVLAALRRGEPKRALARQYGISPAAIRGIARRCQFPDVAA